MNNSINYIDPYGLNGQWVQTGGQEGTGGAAEMTFTCVCDNGSEATTVTRDGYGDDAG